MAKSNLLYTQANAKIYTRVRELDLTGAAGTTAHYLTGSNGGCTAILLEASADVEANQIYPYYGGDPISGSNLIEKTIYPIAPERISGSAGKVYALYNGGPKTAADG